ncbi:MAG: propionyl-CoA carboxylase [Oligoflexia bacterium]|nr:propionyl-CoA carboxylase [Oligoflexia bacterium]
MKLRMNPLGGDIVASADERRDSAQHVAALEAALEDRRAVVREGWGAQRVHDKGKLTTTERIDLLVDPGTTPLLVGTLVNWGRSFAGSRRQAPGAGVVTAFCRVHGRYVMVIANDNTVASGAWWPLTPEKIERAQQMALRLRLPVVYLVDCSGLFLPEQSRSFPGRTGAGHIFKKNSELSAAGVPQIAGVFGDCIAGGGYMPIISDRVYMTERAYMVIAGAALIKGAKSLQLTSLDIGGPEVHVHRSACADVRVPDDRTCLEHIRREVERLPDSGAAFYRHGVEPEPPLLDPAQLDELLPRDHRHIYDIRQVLARLVDGSLFHEFMPDRGLEVCTGVARVGGLFVGFAANVLEPQPHPDGPGHRPGGILYREGIAKLAAFSRACNDDGVPLVWLQDVAGFDIGVEAEALGLLGYGSSLIYTNSTNATPMFTVLLRKASGAGYYAMAGLPYEPIIQLSTPVARQSVMEGRTLAIATYNSKLDDNFEIATDDPAERAEIEAGMARTAARIEADMDPIQAAARMDTDEVVRLSELRPWLEALAEMAYQSTGYRRVKNPRIWSLHDLEVLGSAGRSPTAPRDRAAGAGPALAQPVDDLGEGTELVAPEPGARPVCAPMEGSFFCRPAPDLAPFVAPGQRVEVGAKIGLVEVMKTFSAVRAPLSGVVLRVDIDDGASVVAGQAIAWIRPAGTSEAG